MGKKRTDTPREELIVSRFTSQEMTYIEELKRRVNINTNGKLVRVIMLAVAKHPEFDFLALKDNIWDDLPNEVRVNIALINKIDEAVNILKDQGLFAEDGEVTSE